MTNPTPKLPYLIDTNLPDVITQEQVNCHHAKTINSLISYSQLQDERMNRIEEALRFIANKGKNWRSETEVTMLVEINKILESKED